MLGAVILSMTTCGRSMVPFGAFLPRYCTAISLTSPDTPHTQGKIHKRRFHFEIYDESSPSDHFAIINQPISCIRSFVISYKYHHGQSRLVIDEHWSVNHVFNDAIVVMGASGGIGQVIGYRISPYRLDWLTTERLAPLPSAESFPSYR